MRFDRQEWERAVGASGCFYGRDLTPLVKWCESVAEPLGVSALEFARWANARGLLLMRNATAEKFKTSRLTAELAADEREERGTELRRKVYED